MDQETLRVIVAAITLAFIAWIFGFAAYTGRRHKTKTIAVSSRNATLWQKKLFAIAVILEFYLVLRAIFPTLDRLVFAQPSPAPWVAILFAAIGIALVVFTHISMGGSWRIGVPEGDNNIDELVTTGPHSLSRNPIYLGVLILLVGVIIAAPGPLTLFAVIVTFIGLQSVIVQEEAYLSSRFGAKYADYCNRVRRWI